MKSQEQRGEVDDSKVLERVSEPRLWRGRLTISLKLHLNG